MPRLPMIDRDAMPEALAKLVDSRPPLNLYKVLANAPAAAQGFMSLGGALLRESSLDQGLRELVILRVGALSASPYEVYQHRQLAARLGVPPEKVAAALNETGNEALDGMERAALAFADAVVCDVKASDKLYDAIASRLDHRQVSELVLTIGFYMMVCRFLENAEVELETVPVPLG